jgi:hypothetical protein
MNLDWQKLLEGKRALRRNLAALPIEDKLRLLDALRERALALRSGCAPVRPHPDMLREGATGYRTKNEADDAHC